MGKGEHNRRFVDKPLGRALLSGNQRIGQYEKAGEIALVCLNAPLKYVKSVKIGGILATHGSMSGKAFFGYLLGAAGSVECLDHLHVGMTQQKLLALQQCHRMGVDLGELVDGLSGESGKSVGYAHLVFTDNLHVGRPEQLVVLEQRACYSILDSHYAKQRSIGGESVEHPLKTVALDGVDLLTGEIAAGGSVVVTPRHPLYCDTLGTAARNM